MPLTSAVPKAMFPLIDSDNRIKSVLHVIIEQAVSAGAKEIGVIVSPWQCEMVNAYLNAVGKYTRLAERIECITQNSPRGFGDAVLQGRDFVEEEPFLLLLGDHIHVENAGSVPCGFQVADAFGSTDATAMIGVQPVSKDELSKVGVASGIEIGRNIYRCKHFIEKPDAATARNLLVTAGLDEDTFLAHCGIYVFDSEIFDCIAEINATAQMQGKEVELADAQGLLLKKYPEKYYLYKICGRAYDLGTVEGYIKTQAVFRSRR